MKKISVLLASMFLLVGCAESMALLGPLTGASNGKILQSSLNSAVSYGVKKQTGKTPMQHALAYAEEKNPNKKKEKWIDNCNFDNLDRKLDSHLFTLNRKWVGPSNDLNSILSLYFFLNSILNKRNNFIIIVCIYILEMIFNFLKKIKNYLKR